MRFRRLIIVLILAPCIISCTKEAEQLDTFANNACVEFNASWADEETNSRTILQDDGTSIWWQGYESIKIFQGSKNYGYFYSKNPEPVPTTTFQGNFYADYLSGYFEGHTGDVEIEDEPKWYWAVYPLNVDDTCDGQSVTLTVPSTQNVVAGTFAKGAFPAVAHSETLDLSFYNACGGVRFSVTQEGIWEIMFKSNDGSPMAGTVQVGFGEDNKPVILSVSDTVDHILVSAPSGGFIPGENYFITMLPQVHAEGITVLLNKGLKTAERVLADNITVKRSVFGILDNVDNGLTYDENTEFPGGSWTDLGMAEFTDDLFGGLYGSYMPPVTYKVRILHNDLKPGLYRLVDPYKNHPNAGVIDAYFAEEETIIEIDATNPNAVVLADSFTGMGCEGDGWYYIWSMAGYYKEAGSDPSKYYGKLENGIITFPTKSLILHCTVYNPTSLYYANTNGAFKIKLPGAVEYDYSFSIEAGQSSDGLIPVTFSLGADITSARYVLIEGVLDKAGVNRVSAAIKNEAVESVSINTSGIYDISAEKTGKYTLVAVAYNNASQARAVNSVSFGYIAAGDEVPVVISCSLETTNEYEADGHTPMNSLKFSIKGENIEEVRYGLYTTDQVDVYGLEDIIDGLVFYGDLEKVNADGFSDLFTGLKSLTGYTLVVWATNGYESKVVTAECATEGLPLEFLGTGTYHCNGYWVGDDKGLEMYFNHSGKYSIENVFAGVTFEFDVDDKGIITFDPTYAGVAGLYVYDNKDFWDDAYVAAFVNAGYMTEAEAEHIYDPSYVDENGVFNFHMTYYASGYGVFGWNYETFTLDAGTLASSSVKVAHKSVRNLRKPLSVIPLEDKIVK